MGVFSNLIEVAKNKVSECVEVAQDALGDNNSDVARYFIDEATKWKKARKELESVQHGEDKVPSGMRASVCVEKLSKETKDLLAAANIPLPKSPAIDMKKEMERAGLPEKPKEKEEDEKRKMPLEDIPILKKPVPYIPPKHIDDLDEGPIDLTSEEYTFVKEAEGNPKDFKVLFCFLNALSQIYHHMHWRCAGTNQYGDHLLYDRLYNSVDD